MNNLRPLAGADAEARLADEVERPIRPNNMDEVAEPPKKNRRKKQLSKRAEKLALDKAEGTTSMQATEELKTWSIFCASGLGHQFNQIEQEGTKTKQYRHSLGHEAKPKAPQECATRCQRPTKAHHAGW